MSTTLPATSNSGRGYFVLFKDGTILSFGNAPPFSRASSTNPFVSMDVTPSGHGIAVLDSHGQIKYQGTSDLGSVKSDPTYVDLAYNSAGTGLWALDDTCNVHHQGSGSQIDRDKSQSNVIRLCMSSDTSGKVIDSHGHLYTVDTNLSSTDGLNFDNGAVGGGWCGSQFVIADDHSAVRKLNLSTGADWYPTGGEPFGDKIKDTKRFNVMDIAFTPSGNGYWLLVNFRSSLNLHDQYTVIAVGDARPAGGTDATSVAPYDANHDPVDAVRIVAMPALASNVPDLFLDVLHLPTLYTPQGGGSYNEIGTGYQSMAFWDLGSEYRLYKPTYSTAWTGSTPTGVNVILPMQHLRTDAQDDYLVLKLGFGYSASGPVWRLQSGSYLYYQGTNTPHSDAVDVINDVSDLVESLEEELVELDVMSEGTLTPVLVALDALVVAVKIYNLYTKLANLLDDGGRANFPAVGAHAIVRASNSLGPPSTPNLGSQVPQLDSSAFGASLGVTTHSGFSDFQEGSAPDSRNATYTNSVGSDGTLGAGSTAVTFRLWEPEQSVSHNSGGCLISSKVDIVENNGLDSHCAFLCFFALAQGTNASGAQVSKLTLAGAAGAVEWLSLVAGDKPIDSSIQPCILGSPDPTSTSHTLGSTDDIVNAVGAQIRAGAQNQANCPVNVGEGLANFVMAAMRSMISTLGAV
jgi:hypothetical protein